MTRMSPAELERWREYVEQRTGMAFPASRVRVLEAAVHGAADIARVTTGELFRDVARPGGDSSWGTLFEHLLNNETKFFRDAPGIDALTQHALPELRSRRPPGDTRLAVWSAGCSTGQEAYTLAMLCLADDAIRGWKVQVLGTDVCQSNLDRAVAGVYREFETRTVPRGFRTRFFTEFRGDSVQISREVRDLVAFSVLDLTAEVYPIPPQDVIFCENVLIYYGIAARNQILGKLASSLAPGGYLFLGAVERIGVAPPGLEPVRLDDVWIYRRPA